ncbi:MAG: S1C family serine protease [Clostridium sp.]
MDNLNNNTPDNYNNQNPTNYTEGQNSQYNQQDFSTIHEVSYTDVKEKKKKKGKNFALIALMVVLSISGGLIGGGTTYLLMKDNVGVTRDYAAPEFNKDNGELTKAQAFEKVAPAVVIVSTKSLRSNGWIMEPVEGIGSGFIINEEGYILTNYHVVEGSQEATITLSDKREVKAKVVNYDANQDVAMLKLEDGVKVPAVAELGDSEALYPGQEVIAIGTPLSKDFYQTLTSGIVSAVNRNITTAAGTPMNLIQTDTAINPGNSGGPLVNSKGQVIGINTLKLTGGAENMGFAIPINDVKSRVDSLSKPIINLGIKVKDVNEEIAEQKGLPVGVYVAEVLEFSSAEKAGMKQGDVIVGFDGKKIKNFEDLKKAKEGKDVGESVKVEVVRYDKNITLELKLEN